MSDQQQNLYFIALIPHLELREQIKAFKEEMKEQFDAKHALKSPAHITMQMPFRASDEFELILINSLREFASNQNAFKVQLSGFDCFAPRVIFVKVADHEPIVSLHSDFKKIFKEKIELKETVLTQKIHPHMTIATRDLSEKAFKKAWCLFNEREFEASFLCKSLFLLKHNGRFWDIYREFHFNS